MMMKMKMNSLEQIFLFFLRFRQENLKIVPFLFFLHIFEKIMQKLKKI